MQEPSFSKLHNFKENPCIFDLFSIFTEKKNSRNKIHDSVRDTQIET